MNRTAHVVYLAVFLAAQGCATAAAPSSPPAVGAATQPSGSSADEATLVRVLPADAPVVVELTMPESFLKAFGEADARARSILFWQQCSATVLRLRASGTFGPSATVPRGVHCERTAAGEPLGGLFDVDSSFTRAHRVMLIRLDGYRARYAGTVDTARVGREAAIERHIDKELRSPWRKAGRAFMVVPYYRNDGVTEGWAIPIALQGGRTVVLGGDMAFTQAVSGTLARVVDHSASFKLATLPGSGPVTLASAEAHVPTVSELVIARGIGERGREVTVTTTAASSVMVPGPDASGSRYRWQHTPTPPR